MKTRRLNLPNHAAETKRCAIYTRKSTSLGLEQEFNSLDAQREACTAYILRQPGWRAIEASYDDGGFTGANTDRPAFRRLLDDVDAGRVDVVVVYKVDRLSRSLLDFARVMERFNTAGTSFVSVTQNFSTHDAMGRLTLNMLMSFAEFEREMISERTRDKIAASRRKGKWTGGSVPLGYSVVDKKLVVNELEAALVREIFALYHEHRSALAVVRILNERRHTPRRNTMSGLARMPRAWVANDVYRILKNTVYAGYFALGDEVVTAEHPPLIERSLFVRTQELLALATVTRKAAARNSDYLLRGIVRCARCGAVFTCASTTKRGVTHRYYRCATRDKRGGHACPARPMTAGALEDYVIERLRDAVAGGNLAAEVTAAVQRRVSDVRNNLKVEHKMLPAQIVSLSAELQHATETLQHLTGPARRPIEARLQAAGDQLERSEARLVAVETELHRLDGIEVEGAWVTECLTDFTRIWDLLTPENRARLVRVVVERVELDELANEVRVFLRDLSAGLPVSITAPELTPEAGP
jgi:site-specific DNA recombinase